MATQFSFLLENINPETYIWTTHTVTHLGRTKSMEIPCLKELKQGRKSSDILVAEQTFGIFRQMAENTAMLEIEAELHKEAQQNEILKSELQKQYEAKEAELLKRYSTTLSATESKRQSYHRKITRFGIALMVLVAVFGFSVNYLNLDKFFGASFASMFGSASTAVIVAISILLSVSFAFFAMLKNRKMVKKTVWLLPADLLIAFTLISFDLQGSPQLFMGIKMAVFLAYTVQFFFIVLEISNLFIGKGIQDTEAHYENVFETIFK